ncbi:8213_t:CDS:2 [Dentiscutata erythropus]|uniref:8213_t:CDS:1 n=1 Tax=Dentiscutata erythropus TaxID=1348616 RepID=A0A9N8VP97_9GLOM|nr:8213_t:CDS:2 [Dentiscutata erythropus]
MEESRGDMLSQIGELENLNETHEFKEALELYVKPQGTWSVPIIKTLDNKEIYVMDNEKRDGDVEKIVINFLSSKDKLTSNDKQILEAAANDFLISQKKELLINKVNSFFNPENKLTLEDIDALDVAINQFLALKDKKALRLLEMAINGFLESSKNESVLKNAICNFLESPLVLENKLSLENVLFTESKLALGNQITIEDVKALKKASINKEDFEKTGKELLNLKAKDVLETAVNSLLTLKRKKVLLILGSGGTGKSTFNRHLARLLWDNVKNDMTQPIPLFIALAPLEKFINQNKDFIEVYLQQKGNLSTEQINELRKRKFVFILDGYDEIAERERQCYDSNMFSKWENAKIIISCRPEYLNQGYEEMFWPKENRTRGFQKLTLTPFLWAEIEQYIKNYVSYSKKNGSPLPWDADKYIQSMKSIQEIEDLVCNPILLKITLTVLPGLLKDRETTSQINRIVLYDEFIKKWFERAQERLQNIQLKPKEREEFERLNKEGFINYCLKFGKEFAFKMFVDNNIVVVNYDPVNENTSDWATFLGNTDEKYNLIRFSMPLIRRGNQYWFFHKSLRDYLIASILLDSFKDASQASLFNKQLITPEPAIQQFLVERVQQMQEQMPELIQPLLNYIECSKMNTDIQTASANAITVLSHARILLPKNLNNIRIPGANLSNGVFNNSQLVRADLNNVNFQNANLQNANIKGASLNNTNFQNANLQNANIEGASLNNDADLTGANLRHSNLKGANFYNSYLEDVNFEGASLRIQDFQGIIPPNTNLGSYV